MPRSESTPEQRAQLASNVTVKTRLRVFDIVQSTEVISMPDVEPPTSMRKFPGHHRVTLHALTEDNQPISFDVERLTYERFIQPLLK